LTCNLSRTSRQHGASKFKSAGGIGNGGAAVTPNARQNMAASLIYSPMKGNRNMTKTKQDAPSARKAKSERRKPSQARTRRMTPSITAPEALQLLESAVSYCQQAGLGVTAANEQDALCLFIPRAQYIVSTDGTRAAFQLIETTAPMSQTARATI
jgi:hypothetical protein